MRLISLWIFMMKKLYSVEKEVEKAKHGFQNSGICYCLLHVMYRIWEVRFTSRLSFWTIYSCYWRRGEDDIYNKMKARVHCLVRSAFSNTMECKQFLSIEHVPGYIKWEKYKCHKLSAMKLYYNTLPKTYHNEDWFNVYISWNEKFSHETISSIPQDSGIT